MKSHERCLVCKHPHWVTNEGMCYYCFIRVAMHAGAVMVLPEVTDSMKKFGF